MKNNIGLVEYAKAQIGNPYWYGTFGQIASKSLYADRKKAYPEYYKAKDFQPQYGQRVHDCVGLIKGYMWSETPYSPPKYKANGFEDVSANGLFNICKNRSTDMKKMPEVKGLAVFMNGHVGVYIGGGYVIEARGHAYGVVRTRLIERPWTKWAYIEGLEYITEEKKPDASIMQPPWGSRDLSRGMKGDDVKALQNKLMRNGYKLPKYGADGSFGAETETAVKEFQKARSIKPDGIVRKITFDALDEQMLTIGAGNWNIREKASTSSRILGVARNGDVFPMTGIAENGFMQIVYNGVPAWVSMKGVKA